VFRKKFHGSWLLNTGEAFQAIDDAVSPFIDGVFILVGTPATISSTGVLFEFPAGDTHPSTHNYILKDRTHDICREPICGGEAFETGIGIHASAGITFDLDAIRADEGNNWNHFSARVGRDSCSCGENRVNNYVILSATDHVLAVYRRDFLPNEAEGVLLPINEDAKFLTLATGAFENDICCDHGVFANAKLITVKDNQADDEDEDDDDKEED